MNKILFSPQLRNMMRLHVRDMLTLLVEAGVNFNILCDMKQISFAPELPEHVASSFNDITLFVLAGYTFESIELESDGMSFEAGFGKENVGSLVSIAYEGIVQVLLHDNELRREVPLFTNISHPCLYQISEEEREQIALESELESEEGIEDSSLAFAQNPENSRFFKK